jgi:hypothetical protein
MLTHGISETLNSFGTTLYTGILRFVMSASSAAVAAAAAAAAVAAASSTPAAGVTPQITDAPGGR